MAMSKAVAKRCATVFNKHVFSFKVRLRDAEGGGFVLMDDYLKCELFSEPAQVVRFLYHTGDIEAAKSLEANT